ncbi:hypothetical protein BD413DRAFT_520295 [Trametes elegans]|nr:hypothetical protein BD413DRAFT_520295 [Trametes elegans]
MVARRRTDYADRRPAERYKADPAEPRFAPLLYTSHAGLAGTYVQAMARDTLRDDAIMYV